MQYFAQLKLLIWKNYIIRKRQKIRLCIEIIWPLVLFLILMWVRTRGLKSNVGECHYSAKALPSAGIVPFLTTFYCTFNNPCYSTVEDSNYNELIQQNSSNWISAFSELQQILEKNVRKQDIRSFYQVEKDFYTLQDLAGMMKSSRAIKYDNWNLGSLFLQPPSSVFEANNLVVPVDVDSTLTNANLSVSNLVKTFNNGLIGKDLFCNDTVYNSVFRSERKSDLYEIASTLCSLSTSQLSSVLFDFSKILDGVSVLQHLSRLSKGNTGFDLHPTDWYIVAETVSNIANMSANGEASGILFESLTKNMMVALDSMRDDPEQFLNLIICHRNTTKVDRAGDPTVGLTRLDEIGKRLNFNMEIFGSPEDNKTVADCSELLATFDQTKVLRLVWKQVKPFVRGKILYTPYTPATENIMAKVNESFNVIADLLVITDQWINNISPGLREYLFNRTETLEFWQNITNPEMVNNNELLKSVWKLVLKSWTKASDPSGTMITLEDLHSFFANSTREAWLARFAKIDAAVKIANSVLKCFDMQKIEPVETEEYGVELGMELITEDRLWALIVFENISANNSTALPNHVRYKIRMDAGRVDSTKRVQDRFPTPGDRNNPIISLKYITNGFAYLQDMIEHAIIVEQTGFTEPPGMYVKQFPYPCYVFDQFILAISRTFPMFMVLSWVYSAAMIIKTVVFEKERRLKEVMKVMGLGNEIHWIGWFINSFVIMLVTVVLLTIVLKYGNILTHSDPTIVFVFLTLYAAATISLSFFVSVFFSRSNVAAATGGMIFFVLYLPYPFMVIWEEELVGYEKILVSLMSNVAFGFGCSYFAHYEESGFGLQWSNIKRSPILGDTYSMAGVMEMLALDCVLYALLAWYIEVVFPGEFGIAKPWYFLCTPSYWCGKSKVFNVDGDRQEDSDMEMASFAGSNFEKEPTHLKLGVQIQNLKKVFDNNKVAINNLSINFYEDQITSFLGHNGAGKTTTISILTGLFPQTSGSAKIYGSDISANMDTIRKSLGMCPQFNVLFDHLTVEEHLIFYGCLKGWTREKVATEVDKMIADIGLPHKRHVVSSNLSGGMQRKLSVAIAFVGGSRTVILDEPTAGVDPFARRSIWELLLKYKTGRTIILTTHHMDEADLLGDRIAIISRGRLRCCGSSMFLKRQYGEGYRLTLVTALEKLLQGVLGREADERRAALYERVTDVVKEHVSGAQFVELVGMDLNYVLPNVAKEDGCFVRLFDALELRRDELGIASYGISECTLEEIFFKVAKEDHDAESTTKVSKDEKNFKRRLKVLIPKPVATFLKLDGKGKIATVSAQSVHQSSNGELNDHNTESHEHANGTLLMNADSKSNSCIIPEAPKQSTYIPIQGWWLIRRQVLALHIKRFHHTRRNIKGLICEIVLPALFVCLALIFTLVLPPFRMEPPLVLNPWLYGPPNFVFFSNENPMDPLAVNYEKTLVNHPGLGTRCMDIQPVWKKPCVPQQSSGMYELNDTIPFDEVVQCSCDIGTQVCPADASGPSPPSMVSDTTDILMNLTTRNISDWLVKSEKEFYKKRYGGITFGINNPLAQINLPLVREVFDNISEAMNLGQPIMENSSYVFTEINKAMRDLPIFSNVQVWFNNRGWAAMVAYINAVNNIILRAHLPNDKNPNLYGITATNHPLNFTQEQTQTELIKRSGVNLVHAICVIFAMSFVPASFVLYLIEDRVCKSQHLQFVTGVKPIVYWIATLIWDNLNYLVSALLCVIIFLCFDEQAYVSSTNLPGLILLLVLYGWASIPMMYPASFFFSIPSTAFVVLASGNLFVGTVTTVSTFILEVMDDKELQEIANILKKVFLIFPHYCLGRGLMDMATNNIASVVFEKYGIKIDRSPLDWDFLGQNLLCMFVQGLVFFSITLLIQYNAVSLIRNHFANNAVIKTSPSDAAEEDDVAKERSHIMSGEADEDILKIVNLTKVYTSRTCCCCNKNRENSVEESGGGGGAGRLVAVDRLCFGVKGGECFGLLGVNGAGKTTTFKMLTQDTSITSGDAFVNGHSIRTEMRKARYHIGYCPQFDALDSLLTGLEHLYFYGRLRGIPDSDIHQVAKHQISKMNLVDYADRCSGTYSGGNKRKLSTAIALIGNPSLVFLDEPTTGMDPKARRFLWTCISELVRDGRSVILTSHSLEECEALCTRLAIMVNGRFSCIGSIQHLKNKYGSGYTLSVRVDENLSKLEDFKEFVRQSFPDAIFLEEHHNQLVFQFPSQGVVLSTLFGQMESAKLQFHLEDYSICQTTLDQVFINFAKRQLHLQDD